MIELAAVLAIINLGMIGGVYLLRLRKALGRVYATVSDPAQDRSRRPSQSSVRRRRRARTLPPALIVPLASVLVLGIMLSQISRVSADATRYLGTLAPGECSVQYWHFTYPQCSNSETSPCSGTPVWGTLSSPTTTCGSRLTSGARQMTALARSPSTRRKMTMRNEISAMANKIEPNPNGRWFNTEGDTIRLGEIITSNGIFYKHRFEIFHFVRNDGAGGALFSK